MVKITPNNIYDTAAFEQWLNENSENGLFIEFINSFTCGFKKGKGEERYYKLIPVGKKEISELSDESIKKYAEKNIEYVCTYKEHFHLIFSRSKENLNDILDENEERNYKRLINNNYFYMAIWIALIISVIVFAALDIFKNGAVLYNIIKHRYWALQIFSVIAMSMAANKCRINVKNIKKSMKKGEKNISPKALKYSLKSALTLLLSFVILFSFTIHSQLNSWHKNLENIPKTLPIVLLNMVEENMTYHRYNPVSVGDGLVRKTNSAKFSYSILAPKQYEINQTGIVDDATVEKNGQKKIYTPVSEVDFLRLRSSAFTKIIYNDLIKTHNFLEDVGGTEVIEIEDSDFEKAVIYKAGNTELFFGYYNNNVIFLSYEGRKSIQPFVNDIYGAIEYLEF